MSPVNPMNPKPYTLNANPKPCIPNPTPMHLDSARKDSDIRVKFHTLQFPRAPVT